MTIPILATTPRRLAIAPEPCSDAVTQATAATASIRGVVLLLGALLLLGGCTSGGEQPPPIHGSPELPTRDAVAGGETVQALAAPGVSAPGYRVLGQFVAEFDPVSGMATAHMVEDAKQQSRAVPSWDSSLRSNEEDTLVDGRMRFLQDASGNGQDISGCEDFWLAGWALDDPSWPFWVPAPARTDFLNDLAGDAGNRFCTNFRLINDVGRPLQEIWIIVDGITLPGVRAWIQDLPRVIPSQNEGFEPDVILEPNSLQGMFRYGPFAENEEITGQWYFYFGGAPVGDFRVRGRIVEIFREQCGTNSDDNGDGLEDSGCARFAAGAPCSMNQDCVSRECDGGVPIDPAASGGTLGTCAPSPVGGPCFEDTDCAFGADCDGGNPLTFDEGECVAGTPTYVWSSTGSTDAALATNWSPEGVPGEGDRVVFDGTSTEDAEFPLSSRLATLTMASGYTGTVRLGGLTQVSDGVEVSSGTLDSVSSVELSGDIVQSGAGVLLLSGGVELLGEVSIEGGTHGDASADWSLAGVMELGGDTTVSGTLVVDGSSARLSLNGHSATITTFGAFSGGLVDGGGGDLLTEWLLIDEGVIEDVDVLEGTSRVEVSASSRLAASRVETLELHVDDDSEVVASAVEAGESLVSLGSRLILSGPGDGLTSGFVQLSGQSELDLSGSEALLHEVAALEVFGTSDVRSGDAVLEISESLAIGGESTLHPGSGLVRIVPAVEEVNMFLDAVVFHDLETSGASDDKFIFGIGTDFEVMGLWTAIGIPGDHMLLAGDEDTPWTLTLSNAPVVDYVAVRDSHNESAFRIEPADWIDLGNNEGWGPETCDTDADCPDPGTFCDIGTSFCEETAPVTLTVQGLQGAGLELELVVNSAPVATVSLDAPGTVDFPAALDNGTLWIVQIAQQPTGVTAERCEVTQDTGTVDGFVPNEAQVECGLAPFEHALHSGSLVWTPTLYGGIVDWPSEPATSTLVVSFEPDVDPLTAEAPEVVIYEEADPGVLLTGLGAPGDPLYIARVQGGELMDWTAVNAAPLSITGTVRTVTHDEVFDRIHVGGSFTSVGVQSGALQLLANDGQTLHSLASTPVDGAVFATVPDGEGGWYIGGTFTTIDGQARSRIARFDALGQLHPWTAAAPDGPVWTMTLHDGVLYIGGSFTSVGGNTRAGLAAVSAETGTLLSFDRAVDGSSTSVQDLAVCGGGLYVAGNFESVGSVTSENIAVIDLATENVTTIGADAQVRALDTDGSVVLAAGDFSTLGGTTRQKLAAIDCTSRQTNPWSLDLAGIGSGGTALAIHNGIAWVGGSFTSFEGSPRSNLAAFNLTNGAIESWAGESPNTVLALAASDGALWVAKLPIAPSGDWAGDLRVFDTLTDNVVLDLPVRGTIQSLAISGDVVAAGGNAQSASASGRSNLAEFDGATGQLAEWGPQFAGQVNAIAYSDDDIFVGGAFTNVDGVTQDYIAAFDRGTKVLLPWNPSPDGAVNALLTHGNFLYVGGAFENVGGSLRERFAAFEIDTLDLSNRNPRFDQSIETFALRDDTLYIGGAFTEVCIGEPICLVDDRHLLAAFDTTTGNLTSFGVEHGIVSGTVHSLAVHDDDLYVGGAFSEVRQIGLILARANLALLDASTGDLSGWTPNPNDSVYVLHHDDAAQVLHVAGVFTTILGSTRGAAASFDTGGGSPTLTDFDPLIVAQNVFAILPLVNGDVLLGGDFQNVHGLPRPGLVVVDDEGQPVQ